MADELKRTWSLVKILNEWHAMNTPYEGSNFDIRDHKNDRVNIYDLELVVYNPQETE